MAKHVRMSITVPTGLKARMDALEDPPNWSGVASKAFEAELAAIIAQRGAKVMADVVARLRASKQQASDSRYKEGYTAGQEWAKNSADAEELERLEAVRDRSGYDWDRLFDSGSRVSDAYGIGERFAFWIVPEGEGSRQSARDFWEAQAGDDFKTLMFDDSFVHGFAEGALDVWAEVKDQL
jgi:hypothetical protein